MKDESIIRWRCTAPKPRGFNGNFNRIVSCSKDAVRNRRYGWICDCGRWTLGDDDYHKPLKLGIREIVDCEKLIKDLKKMKPDFDVKDIMQISLEPQQRYIADESVCQSCELTECTGSVRFDKNYFELGYIETNLPMCPHVVYKERNKHD